MHFGELETMRRAPTINLKLHERRQLERWSRGQTAGARLVLRAKIILLAASRVLNAEISKRLNTSPKTVSLWRKRFASGRLPGIQCDARRSGRKRRIQATVVRLILQKTTGETAPGGARWTVRSMAQAAGVSKATVQRVWCANGLNPQLDRPPPSQH